MNRQLRSVVADGPPLRKGYAAQTNPGVGANLLAIAGDCVSDAWSAQCRTSKVSTSHSTE